MPMHRLIKIHKHNYIVHIYKRNYEKANYIICIESHCRLYEKDKITQKRMNINDNNRIKLEIFKEILN